ncbi:MAG: energy transducer TonB [Desulfococcaceae bacterium]
MAADDIGRRSGLLAFAAMLALQAGLVLWAGYLDIDRKRPEEAPTRTAVRFVVAATGPQTNTEPPFEPVADPDPETETPEAATPVEPMEGPPPAPDPPEAVKEPTPEEPPGPVAEEAPPGPVDPRPVEEPPQPELEPPKPIARKPAKQVPKETPKAVVPQKPAPAKPAPPPEPKPEPVRQQTAEAAEPEPAMDAVARPTVPPTKPSAPAVDHPALPQAIGENASDSSPAASAVWSDAKTADALLAALASMIERHKRYPRAARRARLEGDVRVKILVDADGRLQSFELIESSGHRILDEATLAIFRRIAGKRIAANEMKRALEVVAPIRYARQ